MSDLLPEFWRDLYVPDEERFWRLVRFEAEHEPDRLDYYRELDRAERHRESEERKRRRLLAPALQQGGKRLTLEEALDRLEVVRKTSKGWTARCPAHEDRSPSLLVSENEARPGEPVFYCFSGCPWQAVVEALRR